MEAKALRCSRESQAPGVLNKCLHGEAPLTFNPLPFYTFLFSRKGTRFVDLLLTNGTPFTYLV